MRIRWLLFAASVHAQAQCGEELVHFDLSELTNPAIYMDWTNALGTEYTGQKVAAYGYTGIDMQATDQDTGALPGGSIRFRGAANGDGNGGQPLDLLVTVPTTPTAYSQAPQLIDISYVPPTSLAVSQAVLIQTGFACLGVRVKTAVCASGSPLDASTADCTDGTQSIMQGAREGVARTQHTRRATGTARAAAPRLRGLP